MIIEPPMAGGNARGVSAGNMVEIARRNMRSGFVDANDLEALTHDFEMRLNAAFKKHEMFDL